MPDDGPWVVFTPYDKPLTEAGLAVYREIVPSLTPLGDGRYAMKRSDYDKIVSWFKQPEEK